MMRRVYLMMAMPLALTVVAACDTSTSPVDPPDVTITVDFSNGAQDWVADFTDYEAAQEATYQFEAGIETLPEPLDGSKKGYMLTSVNHSDDLFQYIRRQVTGLEPDAQYDIRFQVQLATSAPKGCVGAGGAPGDSVWLKAGASADEPVPVETDGDVRLSVDKGEQAEDGGAALVLGTIANSSEDCDDAPWELKDFDSAPDVLRAATDSAGRLWLFAGTESGFEARTRVYVTTVKVELTKVASGS